MFLYAEMGITKEILGLLSRVMHWPCWVRLIDKLFNILLTYYELMELIVSLLRTLFNILLTYYELMELIVNLF